MANLLKSRPLKPFGAVVDLDLSQPLNEAEIAELRDLYRKHQALLFHNQHLTREQQERLIVLITQAPLLEAEGLAIVSNETDDAGLGKGAILYHSDLAFVEEPYYALSLHALEATKGDSSTRFVNSADVYDGLPAALKERLAPLHGVNWLADDFTERKLYRENERLPKAIHPLVKKDPFSGRDSLYVTYLETIRIPELDPEQSEALLKELFGYLYKPENILEHSWDKGDFIIWNNITLQHARGDCSASPRILQRASCGLATVAQQRPDHTDADSPYSTKKVELAH